MDFLTKHVVRLHCTFDIRSSGEKYATTAQGQVLLWRSCTRQDATESYSTIAVDGASSYPARYLIYVPEWPLGKAYSTSYQRLWIGEESIVLFSATIGRTIFRVLTDHVVVV